MEYIFLCKLLSMKVYKELALKTVIQDKENKISLIMLLIFEFKNHYQLLKSKD